MVCAFQVDLDQSLSDKHHVRDESALLAQRLTLVKMDFRTMPVYPHQLLIRQLLEGVGHATTVDAPDENIGSAERGVHGQFLP